MPIRNYTTSIKVEKTATEIQMILSKHGATSVSLDYENGQPIALMFGIEVNGTPVWFRLPSNSGGVLKALASEGVPIKNQTKEQAERVAWRIVKDWVSVQMAFIESGIAKMEQVFLPYVVAPDGRTLFDHFEDQPHKLLGQ